MGIGYINIHGLEFGFIRLPFHWWAGVNVLKRVSADNWSSFFMALIRCFELRDIPQELQ